MNPITVNLIKGLPDGNTPTFQFYMNNRKTKNRDIATM